MTADLLLQAEALAEQFCRNLDLLFQQARQRQQALEIETRQLRRFLDEVEVRLRLASEGKTMDAAHLDLLQAEQQESLRQEQQNLAALTEAEEISRRLELLLRQVEMSGGSLRSDAQSHSYDPWELALRSQVLYGREQERGALAREVHDGPAQVLSNVAMGLDRFVQPSTPAEVQTSAGGLLRDVRLGLQEVRRFIYDLRPSPLADEPLNRQIERYIQDMEATYQNTAEFNWGAPPRDLSWEEKTAIYRIVQEALQNARQHARAERVAVNAYVEPSGWAIAVSDNGVGFNPNTAWYQEDHWGIRGMRERARLIGADLQIESRPGEGTAVLLRLPLHAADRAEERS